MHRLLLVMMRWWWLYCVCVFQSLFGKEADKLEHANDDEKICILCCICSILYCVYDVVCISARFADENHICQQHAIFSMFSAVWIYEIWIQL